MTDAIPALDPPALADLNFAEMCRAMTRTAGGRILEVEGAVLWAGAHPSPALVNGLIRSAGQVPPAAELLDLADRWFGEQGHGYSVHVRTGRDGDLEALCTGRGLHLILRLPVMVYEGRAPEVTLPAGYRIERVSRADELPEVAAVVGVPFELPDEVASIYSRLASAVSPFTAAVLARDAQGRAVASAWTHVSHGVAGIGLVGTLAAERGKGLGTAVTAAAVRCGYEMGAHMSALQASPAGRPVYARMGYREVGEYVLYGADPPGHEAHG